MVCPVKAGMSFSLSLQQNPKDFGELPGARTLRPPDRRGQLGLQPGDNRNRLADHLLTVLGEREPEGPRIVRMAGSLEQTGLLEPASHLGDIHRLEPGLFAELTLAGG